MPKTSKQDQLLETLAQQNQAILAALQGIAGALGNATTATPVKPAEEAPEKRGRGRPRKGVAQVSPPTPPKINKLNGKPMIDFETLPESQEEQKDIEIDKKLRNGKKPLPPVKRITRVTVKCDGCTKEFKVSPEEVGADSSYKCNNCILKKKGQSQ